MKVIAVAGLDPGTTLHLRALAQEAVQRLRLDAEIATADVVTARLIAGPDDVIVTLGPAPEELQQTRARVIELYEQTTAEAVAHLASFMVEMKLT